MADEPDTKKAKTQAKKKVLVTGGSGLVGKGIETFVSNDEEAKANEEYIFLSSADANLTNMEACRAVFETHKPTHVIHLAAKVGGLFANMREKVEFYRLNTIMNDNVMECCRIFQVEKLVSCLSTCVFPDKVTYPIDETMVHLGPPHTSNEGYAYSKRMIDVLNRCYKDEYGCNFTSIIPTNIFGPHDNFSIENGHVIPGLMHKCYIAKRDNTDFTIWGSGKPLRQFIYSIDLAELTVWTMRTYQETDPIILSVDEAAEVSIGDVARMVAEGMEFKGNIVFDTSKADGQYKKTASNAKLRTYLPDYAFTDLREGIVQTCQWFMENFESARK
mmetsp:Transcript_22084/g.32059  ORF Transcript_22084/g.32059 Transcript_22084/m.32059 type:complete len:331 (-) Transcript_22084:215-1207(-)|eukprot:CAMPEP_0113937228 /NCGR_PEP_ID=MMETSP1339-20121228/3893_1 /TAXON_ID=94617 /ORGANISM="Fibrocapsa japonica" /LENGTH=330 /DNA_ID=CAMNT_0000939915 /DNA_START=18 /DNA_END=1010 /DNA_ORIENTATION=- /assembly_acc=CAM_ASM_000762